MQRKVWESEYRSPKLISLGKEPIQAIKDFVRWLRKEKDVELKGKKILDLGCGNGKNSIYIAEQGLENEIVGIEYSETAIEYGKKLAQEKKEKATFVYQSMSEPLPFPPEHFDITLDATSSNSLNESERKVYLFETFRTMKTCGYFFIRTLCKDGDDHAKKLIKLSPGKEKDTYIMPDFGLTERVFSREDFISTYSPLFTIHYLEKETHYTKFKGKLYKRNFWIAYLQKE